MSLLIILHIISNENLYKVTKMFKVRDYVEGLRLRLFGHVLRLPVEFPAERAMAAYFSGGLKGRVGAKKCCIVTRLQQDRALG